VARQPGALGTHPLFKVGDERPDALLARRQAVAGRVSVDVALDGEDRIDAAHRLQRHRSPNALGAGIGDDEELAPAVAPARRLGDRSRPPSAIVEVAEPGIGIGLENAGAAGKVAVRMLAVAVARVMEDRGRGPLAHGLDPWGVRSGKRPIVAHVSP